jgi:hypothetical protein
VFSVLTEPFTPFYADTPDGERFLQASSWSIPMLRADFLRFTSKIVEHSRYSPTAGSTRRVGRRREFTQQILDPVFRVHSSGAVGSSMIRRTSMGYSMKATTWDAISIARFSLTSTIQ